MEGIFKGPNTNAHDYAIVNVDAANSGNKIYFI